MMGPLLEDRAAPSGESGQSTVELVGFVFLVVLVTALCVQGIFAVQAFSAAQGAARDGARAMSLGQDWHHVVDDSLPGWATVDVVEGSSAGGAARVRVVVRVPIGIPSVTSANLTFDRTAEIPKEDRWH